MLAFMTTTPSALLCGAHAQVQPDGRLPRHEGMSLRRTPLAAIATAD